MAENPTSKVRAEITVRNRRNGRISVHTGRYGLYYECMGYCRKLGYELLQYTAI